MGEENLNGFNREIPEEISLKIVLPSLDTLLEPAGVESYHYSKTFEEASDDPILILHTSGTTGKSSASHSHLRR